jgi:hypothetical protein
MNIRSLCFGAVTGAEVGAGVGDRADGIVASGCDVLTGAASGVETGAQEVRKRINSKKPTLNLNRMLSYEVRTLPEAQFFQIARYLSIRGNFGMIFS